MAGGLKVGELRPIEYKNFTYRGLKIQQRPNSDFQLLTIKTLNAIWHTATGRRLMEALAASQKSIRIVRAAFSNSCDVGPDGLNLVAAEMYQRSFGPATKKALEQAMLFALNEDGRFAWLAEKINATPFYALGDPPVKAIAGCQVTGAQVKSWFKDKSRVEQDCPRPDLQQHVCNSVVTILENFSENGKGSDAEIGFVADLTVGMNTERPAGIGLAHELIHAYWSVLGQQTGWPADHPSTVLFEHKCVGLGHWNYQAQTNQICENAIREEWFGATAWLFPADQHVNRSAPGRRDFYQV